MTNQERMRKAALQENIRRGVAATGLITIFGLTLANEINRPDVVGERKISVSGEPVEGGFCRVTVEAEIPGWLANIRKLPIFDIEEVRFTYKYYLGEAFVEQQSDWQSATERTQTMDSVQRSSTLGGESPFLRVEFRQRNHPEKPWLVDERRLDNC
jgi:hypothetical protein